MKKALLALATLALLPAPAAAAPGDSLRAELQGEGISGTVTLTETGSGAIHVMVEAQGVPEGAHGIHVHETGLCEAADGFKSAGGHLARGLEHGVMSQEGPHPGDLPNVHAQADGIVKAEFVTRGFTLGNEDAARIKDDDGSAIVLHSGPDDYTSQPAGASGDRIACGVLDAGQNAAAGQQP
ncbi:superoxide dismutase family protein [Methylobrevis pamukkalensis]|nr:superoxide dismutase family protein [Methylobrevis pamukkalensis]